MLKTALLFQDHMTLQREKPVAVWGEAAPQAEVCVEIQGQSARCRADASGRWRAALPPLKVSFSETMRVSCGDEALCFADVQVGDVYLAAGQSNMEYLMAFDFDYDAEVTVCANDALRFFDYPEVSYPGQIDEADYGKNFGFWRKAAPEDLRWFSAPAYYCAKALQQRYQIPVAIVGCNWGGTTVSSWVDTETLRKAGGEAYLTAYEQATKDLDLEAYDRAFRENPLSWRLDPLADPFNVGMMRGTPLEDILKQVFGDRPVDFDPSVFAPLIGPKSEQRPGSLYDSMLTQVAPYTLSGILYYQGESDGDAHPELYASLFPALIACFRRLWGEELPFLFVQLAPFGRWMQCVGKPYALIREAQQRTAETVPGAAMAVISDVGMELDIHPKKKAPVGARLALLAEKYVYGEEVLCEAPTLCGAALKDGALCLRFANAGAGLTLASRTPDGAECDEHAVGGLRLWLDGRELELSALRAEADGDQVLLTGAGLHPGRLYAELACGDWYRVNLYNSAALPARPAKLSAEI